MSSPDALQQVLDETRQRFVATFAVQYEAIRDLVEQVATFGSSGPVAALAQVTHRLSGLAGTIGFPTISARARELEGLVDGARRGVFNALRARVEVDAMLEAFTKDVASPPPVWAPPALPAAQGAKILVAEDEADQLAIVTACLSGAGFVPIAVVTGDAVVSTARAERPALILLDIALPRLDGFSACRLLKADPELAGIPVIFMTTGANLDDKLTGLALGADEFVSKPLDMRDLVLRIQLLLNLGRRSPPHPSPRALAPAVPQTPARDTVPVMAAAPVVAPVPAAITVVVAEDDPDVTRIIDAQVRAAGYQVIIAFDGEQTLAAVRTHAPDVLVLDLMMPKFNGFEVLTKLREGAAPRPRIIVLSGRGREQDVVRAFELGADDYMTKPFNPQELMARIGRLLK